MPAPVLTVRPVALVTGAARRLGREIALELARAGHDIALHYRGAAAEAGQTAAELRALGARVELFQADLADEAACGALLPAVLAAFGRVDAVVNNASTFEYDDPASFSFAAMDRHMRANTAPAVLLAQALHAHLVARDGHGCVVNLLDQKLCQPESGSLFVHAVEGRAGSRRRRCRRRRFAPRLRAGGCRRPASRCRRARWTRRGVRTPRTQMTPLRRSSTPEDVARAVRFPDRVAGHHRHHAAGRRRAAPVRASRATCCILAREENLRCTALTLHPPGPGCDCRRVFLKSYCAMPDATSACTISRSVGPNSVLLIDVDLYVPLVAEHARAQDR